MSYKCEYRNACDAFCSDGVTCTEAGDKEYCGIYRQFKYRKIRMWKKSD